LPLASTENILPSSIWVTGLHSHFVKTNESSEIGFPKYPDEYFDNYASQAFLMAKEAGLSAWGITDYNFDPVRWVKSIYPKKELMECAQLWERMALKSAERFTTENFLALSGFEYGKSINYYDLSSQDKIEFKDRKNYKGHIDGFGDIVVYNAPYIAPLQGEHDIKNTLELHEVYQYIHKAPSGMGIFAHPKEWPEGKGDNFNRLELYADAIESMVGLEIWNGASYARHQFFFLNEFILALQKGWKVGAMYNPDNCWPNWGSISYGEFPLGFTIVIPPDSKSSNNKLNKKNLFSQIRKRRFYGSFSPKLYLGILTEDGDSMGDTLSISSPKHLFIQASGIEVEEVRIYQGVSGNTNIKEMTYRYKPDTVLEYRISPPSKGQTAFCFVELIDRNRRFVAHSSPLWVIRK
jgi:hypothetical protein